jgi:beta-glucanase (GH16 family)
MKIQNTLFLFTLFSSPFSIPCAYPDGTIATQSAANYYTQSITDMGNGKKLITFHFDSGFPVTGALLSYRRDTQPNKALSLPIPMKKTDNSFSAAVNVNTGGDNLKYQVIFKPKNGQAVMTKQYFDTQYPGFIRNAEFTDDFDQSSLDTKKWQIETHPSGFVNNELENYTSNPGNIYIKNQQLVLQAWHDADGKYTSGRINTAGNYLMTYGRVDVRAKLPAVHGMWPAIWMLPNNINNGTNWPLGGEMDIMELFGSGTPSAISSTVHVGVPIPSDTTHGTDVFLTKAYTLSSSSGTQSTFHDNFHTFSINWTPTTVNYYVDGGDGSHMGTPFFTITKGDSGLQGQWPFKTPYFIILNLAVGGNGGGTVDPNQSFGAATQMIVDYVHTYRAFTTNPSGMITDPYASSR